MIEHRRRAGPVKMINFSPRSALAASRIVIFVALFAFFVSRVITAVTKLDNKEQY